MNCSRLLVSSLLLLSMASCWGSGSGGAGSPHDQSGFDEGNIPMAGSGQQLRDVNFGYDSSTITFAGQDIIKKNADWLVKNPSKVIVIEGHCDERGTAEYNLALGERRAKSAFDSLRGYGVASSRMSTISYGKELPLDPGKNEAAYAKNRRAHFSIKR